MNDLSPFEKEIKQTYHLPDTNPAFFDYLEVKLQTHQCNPGRKARFTFHFTHRWAYVIVTLLIFGILILAIGPSKVLAQIQAVFGFVSGVGLVDTSSAFRQLAEPVSDTKDGITLTIQSAFLSADQTIITYTMSVLPTEIKRDRFGGPECLTPGYLIFPDGSKLEASNSSGGLAADGTFTHAINFSGQFPANFNQATLVFPCLEGTARGKGPQDWQIGLAFEHVSQDIVVYPVTLVPPPARTENPVLTSINPIVQPEIEAEDPAMPARIVDGDRQEGIVILSVVEKPDSYWITWAYPDKFDIDIYDNGYLYISPFNPVLYDAYGTQLPEPDHETQLELWKYEDSMRNQLPEQVREKYLGTTNTFVVHKSGVAFPVYVKLNVYERSFPEKEAYTEIEFDGSKVQTSDIPIEINQSIQLGSVKFTLEAIEKNQYGGYSFLFNGSEGKVVQCQVDLVGYPSNMKGSRSFIPDDPFHFYQAVMYQQIPIGKLSVRVSQPAVLGDLVSFIGSWSPEK